MEYEDDNKPMDNEYGPPEVQQYTVSFDVLAFFRYLRKLTNKKKEVESDDNR